jgi:hypothetical protein
MKNRLDLVEDDRLAARSCVVGEEGGKGDDDCVGFQPSAELSSMTNHMHNTYLVSPDATNINLAYDSSLTPILQHSVDLEATITPSGAMNVGLFCPTSMLSLQQAEDALEALRRELVGL